MPKRPGYSPLSPGTPKTPRIARAFRRPRFPTGFNYGESPPSPRARGITRVATAGGRSVRRRLFGGLEEETPLLEDTPIAEAASTGAIAASEALIIYAVVFSFLDWFLFKIGADSFIRKHTKWQDWSNGPDDVPKDKQQNKHPNGIFIGSASARAPCMPTREYPNAFTVAMGSPIAASA